MDAAEDQLLGRHAESGLEAGGGGAGEQTGVVVRAAKSGYRRRAQERLLHRLVQRQIAAEPELL